VSKGNWADDLARDVRLVIAWGLVSLVLVPVLAIAVVALVVRAQ
jgi:hypothetical protein